jgi:hypothetical protein
MYLLEEKKFAVCDIEKLDKCLKSAKSLLPNISLSMITFS